MKLDGEGKLLRIFIGEADRLGHRPLYEALVLKAREFGLAGTTVTRGIEGFGAASRLSEDLPLVIEIVDTAEKVDRFVTVAGEVLEEAGCGALMTEEHVRVIRYTAGK
jgi:PII-like signaling protein